MRLSFRLYEGVVKAQPQEASEDRRRCDELSDRVLAKTSRPGLTHDKLEEPLREPCREFRRPKILGEQAKLFRPLLIPRILNLFSFRQRICWAGRGVIINSID